MTRTNACSRCGACQIFGEKDMRIEAVNAAGAQLHDKVRISLESGAFMQALGILYGIPFIAVMLGFFFGTHIGEVLGLAEYSALTGFAAGIFLAYISYIIIKSTEAKRKKNARHKAVAVEVVKN
jgi:sigma-E factor negative regulatory protein RseC